MLQGRKRLEWTFLCPHCGPDPLSQPPPPQAGQGKLMLIGHWTSARAARQSWPQVAQVSSNCQVGEGAETQACGRHLCPSHAPAWEPLVHRAPGLTHFTALVVQVFSKGPPPPHLHLQKLVPYTHPMPCFLFPPCFQEGAKDPSLVLKWEQASSPGQSLPRGQRALSSSGRGSC